MHGGARGTRAGLACFHPLNAPPLDGGRINPEASALLARLPAVVIRAALAVGGLAAVGRAGGNG